MDGTLYRRNTSKIWWGRVSHNGKQYRRSLRTSDKAEAKKRLQKWSDDLSHVAFYGESRHTWKEAVVKYLEEVAPGALKPKTTKRYVVSLGQVDRFLEHLYIDEITQKTIADLVSKRVRAGVTNATIKRDLTAVSRVLAASVAWGWRTDNPAKTYDRSMVRERRDPIKPPNQIEVDAYLLRCPEKFGLLVEFLDRTGMRQEEAASLEWTEVDLFAGTVTLLRTKTSRPRVINLRTLGGDAVSTLRRAQKHTRCPFVFWHYAAEGEADRFHNVASQFREIAKGRSKGAKKVGAFKFRCHDLRHKFAVTWLRHDKKKIYELQQHLGHASIKTTERYLAWLAQEGADAADKAVPPNTKGNTNQGTPL